MIKRIWRPAYHIWPAFRLVYVSRITCDRKSDSGESKFVRSGNPGRTVESNLISRGEVSVFYLHASELKDTSGNPQDPIANVQYLHDHMFVFSSDTKRQTVDMETLSLPEEDVQNLSDRPLSFPDQIPFVVQRNHPVLNKKGGEQQQQV